MIRRTKTESCCGAEALIIQFENPILRKHIKAFTDAGYLTPAHFLNAGIFYAQKNGFIASGGFGSTVLNIRCGGKNCEELISEFEILLESII